MNQTTLPRLESAIQAIRMAFLNGHKWTSGTREVFEMRNSRLKEIAAQLSVDRALGMYLLRTGYVQRVYRGETYRMLEKFQKTPSATIASDILKSRKEYHREWREKNAKAVAEDKKKAMINPGLFPAPVVEIIPVNDRKIRKLSDDVLIKALKSRGYKIMKQVTELREV